MTIRVTPLSPALGAEISGVDLRDDLDDGTIAAILDAWHAHLVLVFRGHDLSDDEQIRFTERFGTAGTPIRPKKNIAATARDRHPAIMLVSNIRENGKPMGLAHDGEMWFHSDMCYAEVPHKATLLYGVEIPSRGGDTRFANMYTAYDNLPGDLHDRLDGRRALQVHEYRRTERPGVNAVAEGAAHYVHPLFITHPATGRRALFANRLMTARIEGLPADESDRILDILFEISEAPDIIFQHAWRPGDLVMWDNRCSNHARTDFPASERRLLRRTTVIGETPV